VGVQPGEFKGAAAGEGRQLLSPTREAGTRMTGQILAKRVLAFALMLVVFMAVTVLAQQVLPMPELQKLAGKWSGWGTSTSGSAFPIEVQIQPDGICSTWTTTYVSQMESTAGTATSQVTIAPKGGNK
jgi:hypothetical protein